jgi:hypothetical protein
LQWKFAATAVFCFVTEEYSCSIVNQHPKESTMKLSHLALAALSVAAFAAHADDADPAGQFATTVSSQVTPAQVAAQYQDYRRAGVNPWSTSYNPLKSFQSQKTREQVEAEYIASRATVAAMTGEDSGSAYLAAHRSPTDLRQFAGQPANAQ